jgi:hypothetical protein
MKTIFTNWFTKKHKLACCTIVVYLGTLFYGIFAHAISFNVNAHPAMYFIVWDMFCGWSSYSQRTHVIAEGESGKYYELTPGPWGDFHPYGDLGREHYDYYGYHMGKLAANCLKQTKHEPITRIFCIEELWNKKYNLPDHIWKMRHDEPKDFYSYYHIRTIYAPDGTAIDVRPNWSSYQSGIMINDNPRLARESRNSQPYFAINLQQPDSSSSQQIGSPASISQEAVHLGGPVAN